MSSQPAAIEELAVRESDGVSVSLLWLRTTNEVRVRVRDNKRGQSIDVEVGAGQSPMDVFNHPYAYAPSSGTAAGSSHPVNVDGRDPRLSA